ncbi:hypothetical protein I5H08_gp012 [Mycobacterium phage Yuna]|uniref:Antitoxin VbhA domain-containing protein n=1 Tax=Mycobacterium phage Yuna TaxID=2599885 RepID=A0A5J6TFP9_9CAUD|nr:hypothetical protein I5H08_gp012 [Mycobacterium phage Yuna]QFG09475.1 hypothetical protein PBI_YUNA_93 [Mycobacterium phage Yuna]
MQEMTETQRRAYGIGKDAAAEGLSLLDLDARLDWAVAEGIVPDTYEVECLARQAHQVEQMRAEAAA